MPQQNENPSPTRRRWSRHLLVTLLATALLPTAVSSQASADPSVDTNLIVDLVCNASATGILSPGLTLAQRNVEATVEDGILSNCVDTSFLGGGPTVLSGTFAGSGEGQGSCLGAAGTGVVDVTWFLSNGTTDTSQILVTLTLTAIPPSASGSGTVTSGRFFGDTLNFPAITGVPVLNPLDCLTNQGLTSISASALGTLTRLS